MKKLLFLLYVKLIRPHTEHKLNKIFERVNPTKSTIWDTVKHLPLKEFSAFINKYEYKPDLLGGIVDHSFSYDNPNQFFSNITYNVDCDNWARIWYIWCRCNGHLPQEVVVTTKEHMIGDSHVICVAKYRGKFWLLDYKPYGRFPNFDEAVQAVTRHWTKYTKENLMWTRFTGIQKAGLKT